MTIFVTLDLISIKPVNHDGMASAYTLCMKRLMIKYLGLHGRRHLVAAQRQLDALRVMGV